MICSLYTVQLFALWNFSNNYCDRIKLANRSGTLTCDWNAILRLTVSSEIINNRSSLEICLSLVRDFYPSGAELALNLMALLFVIEQQSQIEITSWSKSSRCDSMMNQFSFDLKKEFKKVMIIWFNPYSDTSSLILFLRHWFDQDLLNTSTFE